MWFLQKDGKADGPFSEQRVVELIRSGTVIRATLVWTDDIESWQTAESTSLASHFRGIPPPIHNVPPPEPISHVSATKPSREQHSTGYRDPVTLRLWLDSLLGLSLALAAAAIWSAYLQIELVD